MANYRAVVRTNYFRVADEDRYAELFGGLSSEDYVRDFTMERDGAVYHGFGSYGGIDYSPGDDEDEWDEHCFDDFLVEVQKILPDDEALIVLESGYENLRYVTGAAIVCTSKEMRCMTTSDWAIEEAREILGPGFSTQMEY